MRRLLTFVSAAGLAVALATSAQAVPFTGTVSVGVSSLPAIAASGSGSGTSAPGVVTIATSAWAATGPTLTPVPAPFTALNIRLTAPGPCTFTGAPVGGPCLLGGTANFLAGGAPLLVVPLGGLGVAGRISLGPLGSYIDAQSWTAGTATPTVAGGPIIDDYGVTAVTTGYDNRTPSGEGVIKLVAPAGFKSTLAGTYPIYVKMTITFGDESSNTPPVALCQDVTVEAGPVCAADASIDDGSYDPDGDPITLSQSPPGPYGLSDTLVTLTVTDDKGDSDSCQAAVTVADVTPPELACNSPATITPPDAPISFTGTATDNCGAVNAVATGYDCFAFTKKGKRIDRADMEEGCVVSVDGDTITILDSGGVGGHISWSINATDGSGNASAESCEVVVAKPAGDG
jgi:hypothetical protein